MGKKKDKEKEKDKEKKIPPDWRDIRFENLFNLGILETAYKKVLKGERKCPTKK